MSNLAAMPAALTRSTQAGPSLPEGFHDLPLLSESEAEDWLLRVLWLKRYWRQRHPQVPFYSLGLAAYMDCYGQPGQSASYWNHAQRQASNQLLAAQFSPLLQRLIDGLQEHWQVPVQLAENAAWPGFHIYLPHPAFAEPVASIHRDLQYRNVFPQQEWQAHELASFTLALGNPVGSGLMYWPKEQAEAEFLPYRTGHLLLHDGLCKHQAQLSCAGLEERITLQGHAVLLGGRWHLYW